jgi:hypothetical protein
MQIFRPDLARELRARWRGPGPTLTVLSGPESSGKTTLVRHSLPGDRTLWLRGSELPSPLLAREHGKALTAFFDGRAPDAGGWDALSPLLVQGLEARGAAGTVVVWDRASPLLRDPRWRGMLEAVWADLRAHARPVHLVLIVRTPPRIATPPLPGGPGPAVLRLQLAPLGLREATARFHDWPPLQRLVAFGLLGGEPRVWDLMDPGVRLGTNLSRLLLEPGAPLRTFADQRFPIPGRNVERGLALVHALASGAREWGEMRERARVFRTSSELGPYVKALRDADLVVARRSLDAAPGSRNRRYDLVPPLLAFWNALVQPLLGELDAGAPPGRTWRERIEPEIPALMTRRLPGLVRDHLHRHGHERFRAPAREAGGLWGEGYDLPVAGTLASGAPFYGITSWDDPGPDAMDRLLEQVAETRYGYGREARVLLLFSARDVAWEVERSVARRPQSFLLRPGDLTGNASGSGE